MIFLFGYFLLSNYAEMGINVITSIQSLVHDSPTTTSSKKTFLQDSLEILEECFLDASC